MPTHRQNRVSKNRGNRAVSYIYCYLQYFNDSSFDFLGKHSYNLVIGLNGSIPPADRIFATTVDDYFSVFSHNLYVAIRCLVQNKLLKWL